MHWAFLGRGLLIVILSFASVQASGADVRLITAVKNSDHEAIRALLQSGQADVNAAEPDGTTALHWAAEQDDAASVEALLRMGAQAGKTNRYGVTPLIRACLNGNPAIVRMLLNAGADPNTVAPGGETALMTAARTGKVGAVEALLSSGADVNAAEGWRGQTALMWAAAEGNADVVRTLVQHGADINQRSIGGFTSFLFAARQGKLEAVKALLEAGVDVNQKLRAAPPTRAGVEPSEPVDSTGALVMAVGSGHFELAAYLLEQGIDPNAADGGWTALHNVTWVRRAGTGDNIPSPEGSGDMSSLELVRRLVAHGADLDARMDGAARLRGQHIFTTDLTHKGSTAFLMAARTADVELMRLLVNLGADPRIANQDGTTPLLAAAGVGTASPGEDPGSESEAREAVRLTLEWGNDVNAVDKKGETAMHGAAYKHLTSLVPFLVESGARIDVWNKPNKYGWTPLKIAEGVQRINNIRPSLPTAAAIRKVMDGTVASATH